MRKHLWLILLGAGLAVAVVMRMKKQRMDGAHGGRMDESDAFEGAAVIRKTPTSKDEGFEGAAVIRGSDDNIAAEDITGGAGIRSQNP